MTHLVRLSRVGCLAGIALLLGSGSAAAEVSSSQRATAEALFQQAMQLMDEKHFNEACEKFAASQELDSGLGTMLYLADCYDRSGKTASAWALFREAADASHRAEQTDRERIATERASSLETRLSRLEVRVPAVRRVPGLELRLNDAALPVASWNVALPVDPGNMRLEARAPGKRPWILELKAAEGPANQVVEMQALSDAEQSPHDRKPAPVTAPQGGSAQRTVAYVMGVAGIVALAAGGFFGYRAYALNKESKADCRTEDPNACTPGGAALREDAKTSAALSTIATVSGAAMVVSGITLFATAPGSPPTRAGATNPARASSPTFGLQLRGVW